MSNRAEKTHKNKGKLYENENFQNQARSQSTFQFVDNRSEMSVKREQQSMINGSKKVSQLMAFQKIANDNQQDVVQRAKIVQKPAVLGFHHWELQFGSSNVEDGLGAPGQIGAISATEDREAKGTSGKLNKIAKGKAMVRVLDKHLSGYSKVGDLEDNSIDEKIRSIAAKSKGKSIPFNQITNNCQDFVSGIWNSFGGSPDPATYNERKKILNEFTRAPTEEEVAENLANSYLYM